MKRTMEFKELSLKMRLPDPVNDDTPEMEVDLELRPADILVTLPDGRMVAIEQVGGELRVLAWNEVSESPVVVQIGVDTPIKADCRDHLANRLDAGDADPSP